MGTRSLTVFHEEDGTEIAVLYRHYDGYPTGHGAELKEFLSGFAVVNGYGVDEPKQSANGMSCLAAQVVAHFKTGIGDFYLYPAGTRGVGEEYVYTVSYDGESIWLRVQAGVVTFFGLPGTKPENMPVLFDGPVEEFDPEGVEREWRERDEDPTNDFLEEQRPNAERVRGRRCGACGGNRIVRTDDADINRCLVCGTGLLVKQG